MAEMPDDVLAEVEDALDEEAERYGRELLRALAAERPRRQFARLSVAERRVDFAAIGRALDDERYEIDLALREPIRKTLDRLIEMIERMDETGGITSDWIMTLTVETPDDVSRILGEYLAGVWRKGRDLAARELPPGIRETLKEIRQYDDIPRCCYCRRLIFHLPGEHDQCDHSPTGECVDKEWQEKPIAEGSPYKHRQFPKATSAQIGKAFDEDWGSDLRTGDLVGFRASRPSGVNIGKMAATEGVGIYIARSKDLASEFGDARALYFPKPRNPLIVDNEPLHILMETDALMEPPSLKDSPWLAVNKEAIRRSRTTDDNWGAMTKSGKLQDALTDVIRDAGYDSVFVRSGRDAWVVLIPPRRGSKIKLRPAPYSHSYVGIEPTEAIDFFQNLRPWLVKGIIDDELKKAARLELIEHLKGGRTLTETIGNLRAAWEPWVGDPTKVIPSGVSGTPEDILQAYRLENIVRTEAITALSQGRAAIADEAGDYVVGLELSPILDVDIHLPLSETRGSPPCNRIRELIEMDRPVRFRKNDARAVKLLPPLYWNCRTIEIFVTADDLPVRWSTDAELDSVLRLIPAEFK